MSILSYTAKKKLTWKWAWMLHSLQETIIWFVPIVTFNSTVHPLKQNYSKHIYKLKRQVFIILISYSSCYLLQLLRLFWLKVNAHDGWQFKQSFLLPRWCNKPKEIQYRANTAPFKKKSLNNAIYQFLQCIFFQPAINEEHFLQELRSIALRRRKEDIGHATM